MENGTENVARFRKRMRTIGLRALIGFVAFGAYAAIVTPSTAGVFGALDALMITLIGMMYGVAFGLPRLRFSQIGAVVLLALFTWRLTFPAMLWVLLPMALTAGISGFLLRIPEMER